METSYSRVTGSPSRRDSWDSEQLPRDLMANYIHIQSSPQPPVHSIFISKEHQILSERYDEYTAPFAQDTFDSLLFVPGKISDSASFHSQKQAGLDNTLHGCPSNTLYRLLSAAQIWTCKCRETCTSQAHHITSARTTEGHPSSGLVVKGTSEMSRLHWAMGWAGAEG